MLRRCRTLQLSDNDYVVQHVTANGIHHVYFDSLAHFLTYYATVPMTQRTFNEVVTEGPQKMRVDIDCDGSMAQWQDLIKSVSTALLTIVPQSSPLVFDMSDTTKQSCHIVLAGVCFDSSTHCKILCSKLLDALPPEYAQCIDQGVYKSLQYFRMEGSTKPATHRFKRMTHSSLPRHTILDSLIGYTSNCVCISGSCHTRHQVRHHMCDTQQARIASRAFKVRSTQGKCVTLTRVKPSVCIVCNRLHSSENAYIVVGADGKSYFNCWRSTTARYIGSVSPAAHSVLDLTSLTF